MSFIAMKTLAAGIIEPKRAFEYISMHNICAVTIGIVNTQETEISTKIGLNNLSKGTQKGVGRQIQKEKLYLCLMSNT